ncbi:uncharacterized protein LOC135214802 [Macrobrachium nipponense]|uniref:uncharacterized protein LOC135214802 n=1 Tax=Macrobrachium nipponense TaxID=159736 RepID=UPI0030C8C25B
MQQQQQHRTAILFIYTSILLVTTKAQRSHHDNHRIDAYDSFHDKELEQNLNSLQHEQLFLPKKDHLSSVSSELNKDKLEWITLPRMNPSQHSDKLNKNLPSRQPPSIDKDHKQPEHFTPKKDHSSSLSPELNKDKLERMTFPRINPLTRRDRPQKMNHSRLHHPTNKDHSKRIKLRNTQSYKRRATRGYGGVSNQMEQDSQHTLQRQLHPITPDIYPRKRRISRFQLGRNKGGNREHGRSQGVQSKKRRKHMKNGKYPKSLPKSQHRLDLGSHQSHEQKGQHRSARSSCTGGKVWRRGQCRCPSLSNWDEKKSECVCIYGTYKDANGNCRSFI